MNRLKLGATAFVLLVTIACTQPYTPPIPVDQIPRIEVPFGETGRTIKDELCGGTKQYIVRVHEGEDLQVSLEPHDGSVRLTVIDMQTGQGTLRSGELGGLSMGWRVASTGDYLITVYGKPQSFTLTCRIKAVNR